MVKRILFILHIPPPVHGSSVVGKNIKDSIVINRSFDCTYINLNTSQSIEEIGKNPFTKIRRYIFILFQVIKQLIVNKPDICYLAITAKGWGFYKDAIIALIVKLWNVKLVFHFHNKGVQTRQHKKMDHFLYSIVFRNTDAILLSKLLYSDIEKYFRKEHVYICPNGVSDNASVLIHSIPHEAIEKTSSETEILFISNLIESKGLFVLLEACQIIMKKQIPFHCTLVGDEGDVSTEQLQKRIDKLGLTDHVTYVGRKYGKEKELIFAHADIFVFPTFYHNETFGLVNIEAMQYYLPVISTFEGGIPDVVENRKTGILIPQQNVIALAESMKQLILDPELRQSMGRAGRKKYEEEFTIHQFEKKMTQILTEIGA